MRHKVLEILKTFSPEEIKQFGIFLNSTYCNKSKRVSRLFNSLINFYPDFDSDSLTDELLSKDISPSLIYKCSTMKVIFSKLLKAAENYLIINNILDKKFEANDILRAELFKRKLFKFIGSNLRDSEKELESNIGFDAYYYINKFRLATDKSNLFYIVKPQHNKNSIFSDINIVNERGRYLIYFFVTEMIKEYDNLITMQSKFNPGSDSGFILDFFERIDFLELVNYLIKNSESKKYSGIFKTYLALLNAFRNFKNEEYYFEYRKQIIKNVNIFSMDERRFHFSRIMKYCILKRKAVLTSTNFDNELLKIYSYILKNEFYKSSVSDYIPAELFRNILLLGLRLKKYRWVIDFIKKYYKKLNPKRRKNIYNYSLAEYYFNRKMYKEALPYFHKVIPEDFMFKMDLKNLLLIAHFELKNYESALSLIDSYYHFLSKDKTLSIAQKKIYKSFANAVHRLIIEKTSPNKSFNYTLELSLKDDFPYKEWVNKKILEMSIK